MVVDLLPLESLLPEGSNSSLASMLVLSSVSIVIKNLRTGTLLGVLKGVLNW